MAQKSIGRRYHATESKYKGRAHEMYVTYDLYQKTRGDGQANYPKVKRVYIAGDVQSWKVGTFKKRSGREVYGVKIRYDQTRSGYSRKGYTATRGGRSYSVAPTQVKAISQEFKQVVELPEAAKNVNFYPDESKLPEKYRSALQNVR